MLNTFEFQHFNSIVHFVSYIIISNYYRNTISKTCMIAKHLPKPRLITLFFHQERQKENEDTLHFVPSFTFYVHSSSSSISSKVWNTSIFSSSLIKPVNISSPKLHSKTIPIQHRLFKNLSADFTCSLASSAFVKSLYEISTSRK